MGKGDSARGLIQKQSEPKIKEGDRWPAPRTENILRGGNWSMASWVLKISVISSLLGDCP